MLKIFRHKNVTKAILWAILILILPAFVWWGAGSLNPSSKKGPKFVGTIGGKAVSFDDFAKSVTGVRCQIVLNYFNQSKTLNTILRNQAFVGKLAWDRLIMLKEARRAGIKVPDKEVIGFIRTHSLFFREGSFDERGYDYFLRNSLGIYPRNFEEVVRENLTIQKVTDRLGKNLKVTDDETLRNYEKDNSRFKISYLLISLDTFKDKTKPSDEEVIKYYEEHKEEFTAQPKNKEGKEEASRAATFEEVKDALTAFLTERNARPLAVKSAESMRKKILDLLDKDKISFEAACVKLGLKAQETKFFFRSDYLEGVGEAEMINEEASRLKKDEVSKPIEVRKGVIVFRVSEVEPIDQEKFKKAKEDYAKKALAEKKTAYIENWLRDLEKKADLKIDISDYSQYYR